MAQSFATQLAKGFVRSTVNQVGRQTGNVIANNMYGNAHSVPVRTIGGYNYNPNKNYTVSDPIEQTEPQFIDSDGWTKVFWFFFAILFYWYGGAILFLNGLFIYLKRNGIKCIRYNTCEVFIEDFRLKEGWRSLGTDVFPEKLELNKEECPEAAWNKKQWLGKAYMIWGGIWCVFWLIIAATFAV